MSVNPSFLVAVIIIISTLFRIVLAGVIGLGVDESYVVSIAREVSLSYFDHPPLHLWIVWLTARLTGSESGLVLRLPFIAMFAATTWMMYRLGGKLFGDRAGYYTVLFLNISAVFSLSTGSWILPDGPLMFFMTAAVLLLVKLTFEKQNSWQLWLTAGFIIGLGMLAKYHAVFLLLGGFLFLLTSKAHRQLLVNTGPYLAAGVAALMFLPVVIWNQEHHWISFLFQSGRGVVTGFYPLRMLGNIAGQAAWVLPWIWLPLAGVLLKACLSGPGNEKSNSLQQKQWFLCCFAIGPIVLFTAATLWGAQGLFHWQAPGYLMAMPLLGRAAAEWMPARRVARVWLKICVCLFLFLVTILGSHTATGWLRQVEPQWFQAGDPTVEALDWQNLSVFLEERGLLHSEGQFIVAPHWIDAGKIDYALKGRLPVLCLSNEPHHYAYLHNVKSYWGRNALIIGRKDEVKKALPRYQTYFADIEYVGMVPITRGGISEMEIAVYFAKDFSGIFPLPYGQ